MKRIVIIMLLLIHAACIPVRAQVDEIAQLTLNIQKLNQFRQILADMKRGYELISKGYQAVKNVSQGNFNLHETFLNGLMAVSPTVGKYKRVVEIISMQRQLLNEYRSAMARYRSERIFSSRELLNLENGYSGLFSRTIKHLEELTLVVTAGKLRMNDAERIAAIDRIHLSMSEKLEFFHTYNAHAKNLALQRSAQLNEMDRFSKLYQ